MPFGKFETYRDSLHGPLTIRWPGHITPGIDSTHLISLTDIAPTILEIAGALRLPEPVDGRSLLPLIHREPGAVWRDVVVGNRYEDIFYGSVINNFRDPEAKRAELLANGWVDATDHEQPGTMKRTMNKRGITDGTFHYIYNHFFNADNLTVAFPYGIDWTWKAMKEAAFVDSEMADRVDFFTYRAQEELYDMTADPGSTVNLIDDVNLEVTKTFLQQKLLEWMEDTNDPVVSDYQAFLNATV